MAVRVLRAPSAEYSTGPIGKPSHRRTRSSWIISRCICNVAAMSCMIHRYVWTPYGLGSAIRAGDTGDLHKQRPTSDKRAYPCLYDYLSINADDYGAEVVLNKRMPLCSVILRTQGHSSASLLNPTVFGLLRDAAEPFQPTALRTRLRLSIS